jgi:nitrite reductase/ring-hydroxylating ferredoxin subunit
MTRKAIALCNASEVGEGKVLQVARPGRSDDFLAVYNLGGRFYLTDDTCTHALASLANGEVQDGKIFCPLHGGAFYIATGEPAELPCTEPLKTYEIFEEAGVLYGVLEGA